MDFVKLRGASFGCRLAAFLVDLIVVVAIAMVILIPLEQVLGMRPIVGLSAFVLLWAYFAFSESSKFQGTLGKRLLGLKVVDLAGNRISLAQATGRHFSRKISYCVLLGLGTLGVLWSAKKQALHDWSSQTLVVGKVEGDR